MERIKVSWRLVRTSAVLLRDNNDLMLFPILSVTVTLIVIASFLSVALVTIEYDIAFLLERQALVRFVALFCFYLIAYFIIFFANTGLVGAVMIYLQGGKPTLRDSFRIAGARLQYILGYALIMATIGMIFRLIFRRTGATGRILGPILRRTLIFSLLGVAWSLIPYLVVPILVVENIGPIDALKRSTHIIKRAWGEQVVGYASIGLIFWIVVALPIAAGGTAISWAISTADLTIIVATLYLTTMVVLTTFLVKLALESVFSALVYCYATGTLQDERYDTEAIDRAFHKQESRFPRFRQRKPRKPDQTSTNRMETT